MVEPSCPVGCLSHVLHCVGSGFHLPRIQAICKLKFLFPCGANCDGVECHSGVDITEFRFLIVIVWCFPKFPCWHWHCIRPHEGPVPISSASMEIPSRLLTWHRIALSIAAANSGGHRSIAVGPWFIVAIEWLCSPLQVVDSLSANS